MFSRADIYPGRNRAVVPDSAVFQSRMRINIRILSYGDIRRNNYRVCNTDTISITCLQACIIRPDVCLMNPVILSVLLFSSQTAIFTQEPHALFLPFPVLSFSVFCAIVFFQHAAIAAGRMFFGNPFCRIEGFSKKFIWSWVSRDRSLRR